jgi:hypothetical protein
MLLCCCRYFIAMEIGQVITYLQTVGLFGPEVVRCFTTVKFCVRPVVNVWFYSTRKFLSTVFMH